MGKILRDLQYRFDIDGRVYIVEVRAPGRNAAPVSAGTFDVQIAVEAPLLVDDLDGDATEQIVREVMDYLRPLLPAALSVGQWGEFSDVVLAWVSEHRQTMGR